MRSSPRGASFFPCSHRHRLREVVGTPAAAYVMLIEVAGVLGSAALALVDLRAYYLVSMFVLGAFSTSVVYLLQKTKEVRYRRNRASFDRRCDMADAFGLLVGSALAIVGVSFLRDARAVAGLGAVQTAVVCGLFLLLYRAVPQRRKRRADEEPHPRVPQGTFAQGLAAA